MQIYFNPLDRACKSTLGAVCRDEKLQLNLFLLKNDMDFLPYNEKTGEFQAKTPAIEDCAAPKQDAFLRLNKDGERAEFFPMDRTEFGWTISLSIKEIGLYYYSFYIENKGNVTCGYMEMGEFTHSEHVSGFLLTVFSEDYATPEWFKGGVMYQIFPDRFCKEGSMPDIIGRVQRSDWGGIPSYRPNELGKVLNNDFFGGNFKGIQSKLPYLKSLGVTIIYLNPIFEAASNHRYDTSDYMKIDPFLGTEEDFKELVETAKNQGIRIILDGVFNHTGDNSVYFNKYGKYPSLGAYQSKDSPYYSWLHLLSAVQWTDYIADGIVALFALIMIFSCAKKGFIDCFFGFISTAAALILAVAFAKTVVGATGGLFGLDDLLKRKIESSLMKVNGFNVDISAVGVETALKTQNVTGILYDLVMKLVGQQNNLPEGTTIAMLLSDKTSALAVTLIAGVAIFIIAKLVMMLLKGLLNTIAEKIPLVKGVDTLLGAVVGLLQAALIVCGILALLASFPNENVAAYLSKTLFVGELYVHNPLVTILSKFI